MLKKSVFIGSIAMIVVLFALGSRKLKYKIEIQDNFVSETEIFQALIDGPPTGGYRYFFNGAYRYKDAVVVFLKKMARQKEDGLTSEEKAFILDEAFENMLAFKRFVVENCDTLNVRKHIALSRFEDLMDNLAVSIADVSIESNDKELGRMIQARMQDDRFDEFN